MIEPDYKTLGKPDPVALVQNLGASALSLIRQNDTLAAERDSARDWVRKLAERIADLETQIMILTNERDEARALGRIA